MELLPQAKLESMLKSYTKAEELIRARDPEREPYKSKYRAREILHDLVHQVEDEIGRESVHGCAIGAALHTTIGCIDVDVQELSEGEVNLKRSCQLMEVVDKRDLIVLCKIKTLNQLGILWCMREDHKNAEIFLKDSLEAYKDFLAEKDVNGARKPAYGLRDLFRMNPAEVQAENDKVLDLMNAYTYYFLAQVYQKLSMPQRSAECCHTTLRKQLELREFQPLDWVTNAATLSHHYIVHENYHAARSHLAAAQVVLTDYHGDIEAMSPEVRDQAEYQFNESSATLSVSWGKYCLHLLESSMEKSEGENKDKLKYSVEFEMIEVPSEVSDRTATNFEEARSIFLFGQRQFNSAKAHFSLLDHCTNYTEIQQDLSRMHKVLIFFEPEAERRFKMHKRRIDLLQGVYKELNKSIYTMVCRQLVFEMGETYSAMADIKMAKPKITDQAKINSLINLAITCFDTYLNTFLNQDKVMPIRFLDENVRSVMLAHFYIGRLSGKFVGVSDNSPLKIKWLMQSCVNYKKVIDYCDQNPEAAIQMEAELPVCRELVRLLPMKVERLKADSMQN